MNLMKNVLSCSLSHGSRISSKQFLKTTAAVKVGPSTNKILDEVDIELRAIEDAGTWKHERIITTKQGMRFWCSYELSCLL